MPRRAIILAILILIGGGLLAAFAWNQVGAQLVQASEQPLLPKLLALVVGGLFAACLLIGRRRF